MAVVSGSVMLRPVRVALAVSSGVESLRRAVQLATSAWGGMYYVLASTEDFNLARELARISGSDVIVPVDAGDETARTLANLPGFGWKPGGTWGPFGDPAPYLSSRLLGPEANLRGSSVPRLRPTWRADDPLSALYGVWFGEYGDSAYENALRDEFSADAAEVTLASGVPFPILEESVSPLALTALDIDYAGLDNHAGVVVIDPGNPADLIRFWNLRALGHHVFPWPIGHEARFMNACRDWLQKARSAGWVHKARRGDGYEFEYVSFWTPLNAEAPTSNAFDEIAKSEGLEVLHGIDIFDFPPRLKASHPLVTAYTRRFSLTTLDGEYEVGVPLPSAPFTTQGDLDEPARIVAAQVGVSSEYGIGPSRTFVVPNARKLSPLLDSYGNYPEVFNRTAPDGCVRGVSTGAEQVYIRAVPAEASISAMLDGANWATSRSPSGRFATQLIGLLGGADSAVGNQPAARWVLDVAARSPHGKPIASLISTARERRGNWPHAFLSGEQAKSEYPQRVVRYLLARKILRPALPLECPECATTAHLAPESLVTDYSCDMCGKTNPLGLILSLKQNTPWQYKTASTLTAAQIAETMPIMAAVKVLHGFFGAGRENIPYVLGLKVKEGKIWECELDVVLLGDNRGMPVVIIGEVKSYLDQISDTDLGNLTKVQRYLRSEGIECLILAATLREKFEGDELRALRLACERSPEQSVDRYASLRPVLPLVLTARELSAPEHTDDHPDSWGAYDLLTRAEESCRRNLGLSNAEYIGEASTTPWRLSWTNQT